MKSALKFVMALTVTILLMLAFRALAFTVFTVRGTVLEPCLTDGDRVLVNRWSYGLRTGGGGMFRYVRWAASPVRRGDIVVFNSPADTSRAVRRREVMAYLCAACPGDTVDTAAGAVVMPGRSVECVVDSANVSLLCHIYNMYEGREAVVRHGKLYVGGRQAVSARFANDYYWLEPMAAGAERKEAAGMLVPETHVIGRVQMLLYSTDRGRLLPRVQVRLKPL